MSSVFDYYYRKTKKKKKNVFEPHVMYTIQIPNNRNYPRTY